MTNKFGGQLLYAAEHTQKKCNLICSYEIAASSSVGARYNRFSLADGERSCPNVIDCLCTQFTRAQRRDGNAELGGEILGFCEDSSAQSYPTDEFFEVISRVASATLDRRSRNSARIMTEDRNEALSWYSEYSFGPALHRCGGMSCGYKRTSMAVR